MIKVIVADDHKMIRHGIISLLKEETDILVIGEADNGKEVILLLQKKMADIVLMDIDMGDYNGIDATKQITKLYPDVKVLIVSMYSDLSYITKAFEAGAKGYLLKNAGKNEMLKAIDLLMRGETYCSTEVSAKLVAHLQGKISNKKKQEGIPLTRREMEVLKLIAAEYSNPEIAEELFISIRTVDTHRRNLLTKLGAKNTAGLVKYAIKYGLVE
ncbi:MAG: response regulator transcription factor [Chitinophagales bacterium]